MIIRKKEQFLKSIEDITSSIKLKSKTLSKKLNTLKIEKINQIKLKPVEFIQSLQDKIDKGLSNDVNLVFLKQSKFWASSITWVLMGSTAFSLGWLAIAKTDEVAIAIGKLEPKGGVFDVQMPLEGIARELLIKEGDVVKKGQILIHLDTEITEAKNAALQKSLIFNEEITKRLEILVNEGAVSELQYMQQLDKVEQLKSEIKTNLVTLKYQEITSPIDGVVFELQPKGPGYVARSSQPVMKIVPLNNLIAKIEIDNRTIGFVSEGKDADISIDSFPASDFGIIKGKVKSIGSDALTPIPSQGKGFRFPAKIELETQFLELKSGKKLPLQAGMSLSANIKLRRVTYLQLLFNKFSDKANSLKSI